MKKLTILVLAIYIIGLITPMCMVYGGEPPVMPTDYLAAWNFETLTDGKITDLSGNGYNGVIRTAPTMSRTAGAGFGDSYGLVVPAATITNNTQMNALGLGAKISTKNAISISGWFKRNYVSADKEMYLFNVPNSAGFTGLAASVLTSGILKFQVRNPANSLKAITTGAASTTVGQWFHYTFVIQLPADSSGKGTLAIYVDGVKVVEDTNVDVGGMTTLTTLSYATASDDFRFGGNGTGVYNGTMDDVKVYDRALIQSEITALAYNSGAAPTPSPSPTPSPTPTPSPVPPELIAKYDFEQITQDGKIVDTSGKNYNGTFSNQYISLDTGYRGQGTHSTANNDTYMYNEDIVPALNNTTAITVAGWFNNDVVTSTTDFTFFNFLIDAGNTGFKGSINKVSGTNDKKLVVSARSAASDGWLAYTVPVVWDTTKEWHHFVFIADYKNTGYDKGYLGVFVDGVEYSINTVAFSQKSFKLGTPIAHSARFGGSGSATYQGYMDELKVYSYRLSSNEISSLVSDTRAATSITSFKIGANECIGLENARVLNPDDEFGAVLAGSEILTGISYQIAGDIVRETSVLLNGAVVTDLASAQVKPGDTVVLLVKGDAWEGTIGYKVTLGQRTYESTKIHAFNKYDVETEYLQAGSMTFNTKVKNNGEGNVFSMIAAVYSKTDNRLLDISISKATIESGAVGSIESSIVIPENYNEVNFKILLWDENLRPVAAPKNYDIEPVAVTELTMPSIFGSNSVIQRDAPIDVWGKAAPGQEVTVSFNQSIQTATADFKGDFNAVLPSMSANAIGQTMTISTDDKTITYDNILIGDVWLCGGQSNMRWSLNTTSNAVADIADADNYPTIRLFDQQDSAQKEPQFDVVNGGWTVSSSTTAISFSGVGYLFGRELSKSLGNVPIGLISASYGGSRAEAWMSIDAINSDSRFMALDGRLSSTDIRRPTYLYNSMLSPLAPYNIKGVIFYQGEGNAYDAPLYKDIFLTLVDDWRNSWNKADLPIIYAQIAAYDTPYVSEDRPGVRQSQLEALNLLENGAMVVTMDIGEINNQHPTNKIVVAERMALAARGMVYGENIDYKSPSVESITYGTNSATIKFKDVANGLDTTKTPSEFVLVNSAGTEYTATATFQSNDTIVVTAQDITDIAQIKYAYSNFPANGVTIWSNLDNGVQLPASPFKIVRGQ